MPDSDSTSEQLDKILQPLRDASCKYHPQGYHDKVPCDYLPNPLIDEATTKLNQILLRVRIDELKHIDDPVNVYVYWEGLQRPLDRIKQLQSQLREGETDEQQN